MRKTEPGSIRPEQVLEFMAAPGREGVSVLGCVSIPLTFHAQQQRACNLIWALWATGKLNSNHRVAIVGGGLGGIMAAVAATSLECDVTLWEEHQLFHLQSGNLFHRYIHPNVS